MLQHQLGRLSAGYLADVVVLDGNPHQDITALRRVRHVIKDGALLH
jgi:imidazolonepropionase-like amidohydrolase